MYLSLSERERRDLAAVATMSPAQRAAWLDSQARQADAMKPDPPPTPRPTNRAGLTSIREMKAMMVAGKRQRLERLCYLNDCRLTALETSRLLRDPPDKSRLAQYRALAVAVWGSAAATPTAPERRPYVANGRPQPGLAWERDRTAPTGWRLVAL